MTLNSVTYKGTSYITAIIPNIFSNYPDFVTIGAESLNKVLYDDNCGYYDDEARKIDECIYAYLDDEYFNLKEKAFVKIAKTLLD